MPEDDDGAKSLDGIPLDHAAFFNGVEARGAEIPHVLLQYSLCHAQLSHLSQIKYERIERYSCFFHVRIQVPYQQRSWYQHMPSGAKFSKSPSWDAAKITALPIAIVPWPPKYAAEALRTRRGMLPHHCACQ